MYKSKDSNNWSDLSKVKEIALSGLRFFFSPKVKISLFLSLSTYLYVHYKPTFGFQLR